MFTYNRAALKPQMTIHVVNLGAPYLLCLSYSLSILKYEIQQDTILSWKICKIQTLVHFIHFWISVYKNNWNFRRAEEACWLIDSLWRVN